MNRRTFVAAIAGLPFVRWFVPKRTLIRMQNGWAIETFASDVGTVAKYIEGHVNIAYRKLPQKNPTARGGFVIRKPVVGWTRATARSKLTTNLGGPIGLP